MKINREEFEKFERKLLEEEILTLDEKYKILDAMYREAIFLHVLPQQDPLEGLNELIKFVKLINSV